MRIVSLIDQEDVIERILRHLGLWQEGVRVHSGTDSPGETTLDPWLDDPFPDNETEPVVAFSATRKVPAVPECASRTPCSAAPSPPAAAVFDFRPTFATLRPWKPNFLSVRDPTPTWSRPCSSTGNVPVRRS